MSGLGLRLVLGAIGIYSPRNERVRGLLEGSILGHAIAYPDETAEGAKLVPERAPGGRWVAYDFHRPREFPHKHEHGKLQQIFQGRLAAFMLDEIKDRGPDEPTPTRLVDVYNWDHVTSFDTSVGIDDLVEHGMARLTTHGEAYEAAGRYERFGRELAARSFQDDPVFQITPKGNALVWLIRDGGEPKPKESPQAEPSWFPVPVLPA